MGEEKWLFTDDYLDYLESLPSDDREITLKIHIKHFGFDMKAFELFAMLKNKDIEKLKGKND